MLSSPSALTIQNTALKKMKVFPLYMMRCWPKWYFRADSLMHWVCHHGFMNTVEIFVLALLYAQPLHGALNL
jgi:hypothetical protein